MRQFVLYRHEDESGVSGTGIVAEGVQFSNGKCVMSWRHQISSVAMYDSIHELEQIHGHSGKSEIIWVGQALVLDQPTPSIGLDLGEISQRVRWQKQQKPRELAPVQS